MNAFAFINLVYGKPINGFLAEGVAISAAVNPSRRSASGLAEATAANPSNSLPICFKCSATERERLPRIPFSKSGYAKMAPAIRCLSSTSLQPRLETPHSSGLPPASSFQSRSRAAR